MIFKRNRSEQPKLDQVALTIVLHLLSQTKDIKKIMTQLDDLTSAVATLQADVTKGIADLQAAIAAAQSANPTVDLSGVIAAVNAIDAQVKAADVPVVGP